MPANSFPLEKTGAFYIDESGLKSLVESVKKFTKSEYTISVTFADEFTHDTKDVDKLFSHQLFRLNKAKRFSIRSSSPFSTNDSHEIRIGFSERFGAGRVIAEISSDTDDLHIVRAEIDREIHSFRTKYDYLYRIYGGFWFIVFLLLGFIFGSTAVNTFFVSSLKNEAVTKDGLTNIFAFSIFVGVLLSCLSLFIINRLKLIFYPGFTLAIGKGKDNFIAKSDTRKWAYRALFASIAAYIARTYIFNS